MGRLVVGGFHPPALLSDGDRITLTEKEKIPAA
jgi:hypothetical protein